MRYKTDFTSSKTFIHITQQNLCEVNVMFVSICFTFFLPFYLSDVFLFKYTNNKILEEIFIMTDLIKCFKVDETRVLLQKMSFRGKQLSVSQL